MLRKIKPLEWRDDVQDGYCFCGELAICYWQEADSFPESMEVTVYTKVKLFKVGDVKTFDSLTEAKAAVEQAFVKWLDTFSEEMGE